MPDHHCFYNLYGICLRCGKHRPLGEEKATSASPSPTDPDRARAAGGGGTPPNVRSSIWQRWAI